MERKLVQHKLDLGHGLEILTHDIAQLGQAAQHLPVFGMDGWHTEQFGQRHYRLNSYCLCIMMQEYK